MYLVEIGRWMALRVLGSAPGWLWLTGCLLGLPVLRALSPEGILSPGDAQPALPAQAAFLASLTGMMLATGRLLQNDWLLERGGAQRRLLAQSVALLSTGLVGAVLVLAGNLIPSSSASPAPLEPGQLLAILLACVHLAALGATLLQLPPGLPGLPLVLPLAGWVLPALLPPGTPDLLLRLLAIPRADLPADITGVLASLAPILFWAGLATLTARDRAASSRPLMR